MGQIYCSRTCKDASLAGEEPKHLAANRGRKPRTYYDRNREKHGSAQDREWRSAVFQRDNYTCQECGQVGGRLNADHIKPYGEYPELRFDVSNGRTLCVACHRKTPTFGWRGYWLKRRG
jgi:5-methylcytosine-specific restriction endonuclease McrA